MFQKILCFTFVAALLFQASVKTFVFAQWYENQAFIAKNLCENRDKPALKCHGKCKLMKALAALEQKDKTEENKPFSTVPHFLQETFFTDKINFLPRFITQDFFYEKNIKNIFLYHHTFKDAFVASFWHPPSI
jgi:hypothetical protein